MALLPKHSTPAILKDVPDNSPFFDAWHRYVDDALRVSTRTGSGSASGEFYDAHDIDVEEVGVRTLAWMAFPRRHLMESRNDREQAFASADDRDQTDAGSVQDEYCEWRVERTGGKISKITLTTEAPEYFERLWANDRDEVVRIYRTIVDNGAVAEGLAGSTGDYDRENRWNKEYGIAHLKQSINTLDAAFGLARGSADSGGVADNYEHNTTTPTSVDPRVILDVGSLVRKGLSVTLRDPIGIYITHWDDTGWTKPDGSPVGNYWNIVRQDPSPDPNAKRVIRLEYEVHGSEGFLVGDISIGGRPIEWGGHVAEHVTVSFIGSAGTRVESPAVV